jgi:NitT/TauT family transport system permease protein
MLGFTAALLTGFLISLFRPLEEFLLPIARLLAPISPVAWIPLALVWFGVGNKPAIFVVTVSVFFVMTIATVANIKSVKQAHIDLGRRYAKDRLQIMRYIVLPEILPSLFLVLRINLFAAWMSVLAAEMVGVSQGLGAMVMVGRALFNMKIILIAMILIGLCGYFLDQVFLLSRNRMLRWSKESTIT